MKNTRALVKIEDIRCLILDDSKAITGVLQSIAKDELGVSSATAVNRVDDAITFLQQNQNDTDVIFCDLNMPEIDGVEFLRMLSDLQFDGYIVIVSSVSHRVLKSVEQLARSHKLKLLGTIIKPVSVQSVRQVLSGIRRFEQDQKADAHVEQLKIYELVRALDNGQFECYYQPQVCAINRKVLGFEALTRLRHPSKGLILPGRFINQLEEHTLIRELTERQIEEVFQQWRQWNDEGESYNISINISALLLNDLTLPDYILKQLSIYQMPAEYLTLEVTESCLHDDRLRAMEVLSRLSMNGINLSIDDFGTGYSSIERLQELPFNEVKIDRLFVQNAAEYESERPTLDSMIGMAKRLGLRVVLEGVETLEHWRMVCHSGCDSFQGFFIARPMGVDKLKVWLENWEEMTN